MDQPRATKTRVRPAAATVLCGAALALLCGCGDATPGSVSGAVTYKENPLKSGWVVLVHPDTNRQKRAMIQKNGSYDVRDVPPGTWKVAVEPPPMRFGDSAQLPSAASDPQKSGWQCTVRPRETTRYDIHIQP